MIPLFLTAPLLSYIQKLLYTKLHFIRMEFTLFIWALIVWYLYHKVPN